MNIIHFLTVNNEHLGQRSNKKTQTEKICKIKPTVARRKFSTGNKVIIISIIMSSFLHGDERRC